MKTVILYLILFIPIVSFSQEIMVTGTVKSGDLNETLPGATVKVKGDNRGVVTGIDGGFKINVNKGDVLVISFIGMKTMEVIVNEPIIKVELEADTEELEEVVIVSQGYFDVNKEDLTGSIVQVGSEQIDLVRSNSIENILQGQVAGVVVSESSEPGGGFGVSIRGTNSILGGTQPLYVVDGIPINPNEDAEGDDNSGGSQSSLSFLNPNDIEKIEVLKDAAATALYGARGANGVVIITTKTADENEGSHSFTVVIDQTISHVNNELDVLTGPEYEEFMNQRVLNQLYSNITNPNRVSPEIIFDGTQELNATNFAELEGFSVPYPESTGVSTNWQDETYRAAYSNALNMAYRGGSQFGNVSLSLGYLSNEGVIVDSDFNRVTMNINATINVKKKLKIYTKTNLARSWGNASSTGNGQIFQQRGIVSQALLFQPIFELLDASQGDEIYATLNNGNIVSNPYTLATELTDEKRATNLLQSLSAVYRISKDFSATLKGAYNFQRNTRDIFYPQTTTRGRLREGEAIRSYLDRTKKYVELNLRYKKKFNKHGIDAIIIGTYEETNDERLQNRAVGFGNDATSYYNFEAAGDIFVPRSVFSEFSLLSGLTRIGYNYKRKYFFDVNARVDASSKFADNEETGFFPSASLGWIASKEPFLENTQFISFLKLRASYGQTGSNPIVPYQSLELYSPIRNNFDGALNNGFTQSNLNNPDLTWETTEQFNLGFDLNMWDARVRIVFDAYLKTTDDLLQSVRIPASNGFDSYIDNFGTVENKGFDLSISGDILNRGLKWTSLVNFSLNRNELTSLNSNLDFQLGPNIGFARTNPIIFRAGSPVGIFWGAQTDGIYANWEEANASGLSNAAPGEIRYINNNIDLDSEGNPSAVQEINFDDYVQIGDPNPDFTFGITNNLNYGKWDLSILITGQKGGDIFWVDSWQLNGINNTRNVLKEAYDNSWRAPIAYVGGEDGQVIYDPTLDRTNGASEPAALVDTGARAIPSDRQVFDGSFVRLKNVNLGYTYSLKNGQNLRVYLSGRNLITITDYPGYDPEIQTYNRDPQRRGVDFGSYPGVRSYILGLKFNF
ncbi:MAG: SusC/RagA family TonB-linked outer membrane protein [Bacteroidota bacterium]